MKKTEAAFFLQEKIQLKTNTGKSEQNLWWEPSWKVNKWILCILLKELLVYVVLGSLTIQKEKNYNTSTVMHIFQHCHLTGSRLGSIHHFSILIDDILPKPSDIFKK